MNLNSPFILKMLRNFTTTGWTKSIEIFKHFEGKGTVHANVTNTIQKLIHVANLYTNTLLGGFVSLSVCSSAIETTFPLSNFKTKHIFRISMALRKHLKPFGALQAPEIFFSF